MNDLLFDAQKLWAKNTNAEETFIGFAAQLGLDKPKFIEALHAPATQERISSDMQQAKEAKFDGSPAFLLNGQRIYADRPGVDQFAVQIDAALAQIAQFSANEIVILSDTHGYDFTQYLYRLTNRVRSKWYALIPDSAKRGEQGRVVLIFTVLRNGAIQNVRVLAGSGTQSLDEASSAAIRSASPAQALPDDFNGDRIDLQFTFSYNQK